MSGDDVAGKPILGDLPPEWTDPVPEPEPEGLTEEDKDQLRKLLAIYRKALEEQGALLTQMNLTRIHKALQAAGAHTVFALFMGLTRSAAELIGEPMEENEHGVFGSVILTTGAETPSQVPQLLLQPQSTPIFLRFIQAGVYSLVRMHGLSSFGPLLDVFETVSEQLNGLKRALAERGRFISEMVEKAFAEQELEEWKKTTGGALA